MKKLFLLSAAALMVLASCTKDEVAQTPNQKITFSSPVVKPSTKVIVDDVYPKTENFNVFANYTEDVFTSWSNATNALYMNAVTCGYITADNAWGPNPEYYWPKNDSYLTFAAYSPSSLKDKGAIYDVDGFELPNYVIDPNVDVLYSDRTFNKQANGGTNPDYSTNAVDIDFHHALSLIKYTAKIDKEYNNLTFVLNSVKISENIVNKGSFEQGLVNNATNENVEGYPKWTNSTEATDVTGYDVTKDLTLSITAQDYNNNAVEGVTTGGFIVLPQTISEDATITITYTVTDDRNNIPVVTEKTFNLNTFFTAWNMGYKYTYNIIIGADVIRFNPDVVAWETTDASTDINI